jgi:creatinine amidohydrolase
MSLSRHALGDSSWPDIPAGSIVLVPIGSTEQHGPHLPLDTDTVVAAAVADAVADAIALRSRKAVLVAPPVSYGSSGEHQSFPGTASIGFVALRFLVVELVRSLSTWADRIVLVNAHGGNVAALSAAVSQLTAENHSVAWAPCVGEGGDLHAGRLETSLMLHLRPRDVRLERSAPGDLRPLPDILPELRAGGVRAVSPSGVLGDPTGATADEGSRVLQGMVEDAFMRIMEGTINRHGMLTMDADQALERTPA